MENNLYTDSQKLTKEVKTIKLYFFCIQFLDEWTGCSDALNNFSLFVSRAEMEVTEPLEYENIASVALLLRNKICMLLFMILIQKLFTDDNCLKFQS